jgi:hypothetical protein
VHIDVANDFSEVEIECRRRRIARRRSAIGRAEAAVLGNVGPYLVRHHPVVPQELERALVIILVIK